jgi:hypothetical protein
MTTTSLTRLEADVASNLSISPKLAVTLCDELSSHGFATWEEVEDALFYVSNGPDPVRDFVDFIIEDVESIQIPHWVVVDYQLTWDCNLRHDYIKLTDGETTYFLFNQ